MTEREDTIERIERVLKLTHKESITVTIPRLTAERAVALLKELEVKETMDIRDIASLWCDDITFCPEKCGWKSCPRNKENIRDRTIPHSYSVEIPQDCPKQKQTQKSI